MSNKYLYQFDLNFHGDYIKGMCHINEDLSYFQIENPQIKVGCDANKYNPNLSKDNTLCLSKHCVVCFYKI